jgi:DNA-directed RNA polymerase subunit M/transcription elongation factor TFIIS
MLKTGNCPNCKKTVLLVGDKETEKAHCEDCDAEIECNKFLVRQLIEAKRTRGLKKNSSGTSYDLYCSKCKIKDQPIMKNNKLFCSRCGDNYSNVNKIIYDNLVFRLKERDKISDA